MAGSKGGKHSQRKGNPKYNKIDSIKMKTEASQTSNIHSDVPRDLDDDIEVVLDFELPTTTRESSHTLDEMEQLLYVKLDLLYTKAQDQLLKSGYSKTEVESAILHAGSVHGKMDILNNVCQNTIAYIEKKSKPGIKDFKDLVELYKCTLENMVDSVNTTQRAQRRDAIWHLLVKNWGFVPSTITLAHQRSRDKSSIWFRESHLSSRLRRNEDIGSLYPSSVKKVPSGMQIDSSSKKACLLERIDFTVASLSHLRLTILIVTDGVQREIKDPVIRLQAFQRVAVKPIKVPNIVSSDFLRSLTDCSYGACLVGCLESNSDDPKTALIVELVKNMRELHEKVKEQKEWAEKKVLSSAITLSKELLELKMLRTEEFDRELNKQERLYTEKSCILMLIETEQGVHKIRNTAMILNNTMKRLARENAQMRADIQAIKLNASEYEKDFGEVLKRERRSMRKLADVEKQTRIFQSQFEEEKQRIVQLETELLQAEKELVEAEMKWKHETAEKENTCALLSEETKKVGTQKANSRAQLLKFQQKADIDSQLARDDLRRLENELSSLRISDQMLDTFLENDGFWCDSAQSSSSKETIRHWICMSCLQNEVSVVFLPCTHQVLCSPCYSENFKTAGGCCPYCHVNIEGSIKAYGPSS
ncbi:hypothetical protein C2S51_010908 [Perilla frutescens var. frutescens]|nr:hypothetical protein C2S51_010908 [Perilla frutescens var. frutescens]